MPMPPLLQALAAAGRAGVRLPGQALLLLLRGYRLLLSPWLGSSCRFEPSCSVYAMQAIERHGALAGSGLAGWRVLRCHPWCQGGCDPVPKQFPKFFTGLTDPETRRKTKV
jgi:putative membrane protein insertion efficiency factor